MGFYFRKAIKFGLLNINFSGKGIGISFGIPGFRVGKSATGSTYVSGGLPGTGMQYRKNIGAGRKKKTGR